MVDALADGRTMQTAKGIFRITSKKRNSSLPPQARAFFPTVQDRTRMLKNSLSLHGQTVIKI